jgi:RNA polymerase sigma-70 factor (ECF subfamily)
MESDIDLINKALSGGSHHYGVLIQRYSDYLFGLGMRLTAGNRALAEDISQQSFLKSYTYLASFDRTKSYKHWLTGIAVNCFRDAVKKEQAYTGLETINEPMYTPELEEGGSEFFRLIKPLDPEHRSLFTLRYVYDHSVDEIAELTQLNAGTVKSKLSRAMEVLRQCHA